MTDSSRPAIEGHGVGKLFKRAGGEMVTALDDVSLTIGHGGLAALVGPDGAGKTTLIRLMAGLLSADSGTLSVLGIDIADDPQAVQDRIGYMPQKFGLYEDLSVQENLDLYADLHGVTAEERRRVYPQLMDMTALGPFAKRLAGRLSGGMKQKLGLACTLVRAPIRMRCISPRTMAPGHTEASSPSSTSPITVLWGSIYTRSPSFGLWPRCARNVWGGRKV